MLGVPGVFRRLGHRGFAAFAAGLAATLAALLMAAPAEAGQLAWTGTWATAQHASYDPGTSEVTVRIPVRVSAGGLSVRIRLANGFTDQPVTIGHATVGAVMTETFAKPQLPSRRDFRFSDQDSDTAASETRRLVSTG
ncbi:hypothetical protein ACWEWX_14705 [Streptomyces asiaticus]